MTLEVALACLALNVYHEARGEPVEGQVAVALVTLNRAARDTRRVCSEVWKPYQFSWTIKTPPVRDMRAWHRAHEVARAAWSMPDFTGGATHFHADHVSPRWASTKRRVGKWGRHIFYRKELP